jgi:glycosyltransferase involved in cell wall biosynthesis
VKVLYLYDGEWPKGATRVRKETRALAQSGHAVSLVARNADNAATIQEEPWMTVYRLPRFSNRTLRYALNFPLFINPVWLMTIWRIANRIRPDLILVCDLPLAPCAIWIGWMLRIVVHYDMGEVYPEFLRSLRLLERQGPLKRLIRTPAAAELLERYVLRRVAVTYVVSEESRDRCIALGVPPERLVIVGNTPDNLAELQQAYAPPTDIADFVAEGREILLFVGIIIADRGVLDAIRALSILQTTRPNAALVVVGDGPERPRLEEAVRAMGLESSVRIVGWKLPEQLASYYHSANIGLLPFRDSPHVRLTLANKLFDYMGAGLAVLAADLPPNRRVLGETGAGHLHAPDSPRDIARVAEEMLQDPESLCAMGALGRRAVNTVYNWNRDAERLCLGAMKAEVRVSRRSTFA